MFSKLWGRSKANSPQGDSNTSTLLNELNTNYVPLSLPHKGNPAELSDAQVDENEHYMRSNLQERVRNIKALLAKQGVHWPESLTGIDHEPLVLATREWAKVQWPVLRGDLQPSIIRQHWLHGDRENEFIGLSVVSDIALLIGELIVANRPTLHWGIDKDPINRADGMATYNRWLLLGKWLPDPENIITVDVEGVLNRLFIATDDQNENLLNTWQIMIRACLDGGHEGAALVRPG